MNDLGEVSILLPSSIPIRLGSLPVCIIEIIGIRETEFFVLLINEK